MSYVNEKGWGIKFPHNLIRVRIQANTSYQIKRVMEMIGKEKGLIEMDRSEIMRNHGDGPKLRQFATFKDLKSEKLARQREERKRKETMNQ